MTSSTAPRVVLRPDILIISRVWRAVPASSRICSQWVRIENFRSRIPALQQVLCPPENAPTRCEAFPISMNSALQAIDSNAALRCSGSEHVAHIVANCCDSAVRGDRRASRAQAASKGGHGLYIGLRDSHNCAKLPLSLRRTGTKLYQMELVRLEPNIVIQGPV
jgi:hypothetical protein